MVKNGKVQAEAEAVASVTADSVYSTLVQITSLPDGYFPTRNSHNRTATEASLKFLQDTLESAGFAVCRHDFKAGRRELTNIIAHMRGTGPGSVTLGAHYDSLPETGKAPGAVDNGSGVAVLLAVAKAFADAQLAPARSVYFTAFAGEEDGLLGSKAFAQALLDSSLPAKCQGGGSASFLQGVGRASFLRKPAHAAIVMDEVAWQSGNLKEPTVNLESSNSDATQEVMQHLAQSNLKNNDGAPLVAVHNPNPYGSDHLSFLDRGIPAVMTINGDDGAYPSYHSSGDVLANVDKSLMLKIARMNLGAVMRMSSVPS